MKTRLITVITIAVYAVLVTLALSQQATTLVVPDSSGKPILVNKSNPLPVLAVIVTPTATATSTPSATSTATATNTPTPTP